MNHVVFYSLQLKVGSSRHQFAKQYPWALSFKTERRLISLILKLVKIHCVTLWIEQLLLRTVLTQIRWNILCLTPENSSLSSHVWSKIYLALFRLGWYEAHFRYWTLCFGSLTNLSFLRCRLFDVFVLFSFGEIVNFIFSL